MFHEVQLILKFIRSKRAIKRRLYNGSCEGHVLKNIFWTCFVALSRRHMFSYGCCIPVTVLNEYKLFPRFRDDDAIINTLL